MRKAGKSGLDTGWRVMRRNQNQYLEHLAGAAGTSAMTGSLLGYLCYFGIAFAAIMMFLTNVLGDSAGLSRVSHQPGQGARNIAANASRALKKHERLQALIASEKETTRLSSGNPEQLPVVTAPEPNVEKNMTEVVLPRARPREIAGRGNNAPRTHAPALSFVDESSYANRRYGQFTSLNIAR
jgi:hypothetical protein